ncbi:lipid acyl hydrolase [Grosmannia clavigera kw1407]|uniref:Lipid acyl hydrolase n=2 Tax=Ophiostomataceae TaxID=5152 RepID=F0XPS3_GROCL|nr:lipid acyl hydrolase [Grosmannia clavigera kw1407]EFX00587.1 lipid acyl hydrolase [Grosmannia clavigera kw1407]
MTARTDGSSHGAAVAAGPTCYGFPVESLDDASALPDFYTDFLLPEDVEAFIQALAGPDPLQSPGATGADDGQRSPAANLDHLSRRASTTENGSTAATIGDGTSASAIAPTSASSLFITAKNDWAPIYEKVVPSEESRDAPAAEATGSGFSKPQPSASRPWSFLGRKQDVALAASGSIPILQPPAPPTLRRRRHLQQRPKQRQRVAAASAASTAAGKRSRAKTGPGRRTQDETREGYLYGLLKWPFLLGVFAWIIGLSIAYLVTRLYISSYEQLVTWRGRREKLRKQLRFAPDYRSWVAAAEELDAYLGNDRWREDDEFAFYDFRTVRRVVEQLRRCRAQAETKEAADSGTTVTATANSSAARLSQSKEPVGDLKALVEACVKNNFAGVENRHLYSQTYYGTKNLVQRFVEEVEQSLQFLSETNQLDAAERRGLFKRLHANYGRTALCLSGGASFAYYHFGVVKALLEEDVLPDVITGTSGGALVAALVATRTNDELRQLLVPALAGRLTACHDSFSVWLPRWWRTGARFDSVDWARRCAWWTRGSMTFREAYERTGRILNVTCVPADPHSPTILCNYRTSPDCVIWSAVLASAAVPGILNPVVLMMKTPVPGEAGGKNYRLVPYSFGHKWKDGSLRTDIPLKALNLHFNVNFTVVSQVNPHVNLFFFSSRGSVGQPVTHRKGRGWRGGYLGSASEEYFKQDLRKWLKLLRNLELLPRPLGQDWSQLWLQPFSGTVTIWPKSVLSDFVHILSDPNPTRLAHMLHEGCQSAFPPLNFVANRLRVERMVERGRLASRLHYGSDGGVGGSGDSFWSGHHAGGGGNIDSIASEDEFHVLLAGEGPAARRFGSRRGRAGLGLASTTATSDENMSLSSSSSSDVEAAAARPSVGDKDDKASETSGMASSQRAGEEGQESIVN